MRYASADKYYMVTNRIIPFGILLLLLTSNAVGQPLLTRLTQRGIGKFIYQILNDTSAESSSKILVFPVAGYAPETSLELSLRAFSLYYTKNDTLTNRLSEFVLHGFVTLRGQFGAQFENAVYSDKNKYYLLGRVRYQRFPLLYYGIGPLTDSRNPALVTSDYIQVRQRLLRQVTKNWYVGPEIDFQSMQNVAFKTDDVTVINQLPGGAGSTTLELGGSLIYDNRKNVLNARKGAFFEATVLKNVLNTSEFTFQRLFFDGRFYRLIGKNQVIALQATGMYLSGQVPYNSLALLGGENIMRGYYLGRYRDKNLLTAQAEIRWLPFPFSQRWGGVLFGGLGTVSPMINQVQFDWVRWAVGGGVRFLFFQRKDVYLRADLGVTREGNGIYFSLGEAF